jgi:hypothetical protein
MAKDVTAILIGTGTLYTDEIDGGEALFPADPTTAPAAGWEDAGYTDDGVTVEFDPTIEDVYVAELTDAVDVMKTQQQFSVSAALAQTSLETLQLAMGGTITADQPAAGFDTWVPNQTTVQSEFQLLFRSAAPGTDKARDWQFPRCIPVGATEIQHTKAPQKTMVAISFRVLVPSAGSIVSVIDEQ